MPLRLRITALLACSLLQAAPAHSGMGNIEAEPSGGPVLRVGVGCAFSSVQAAINSVPLNGSATIRINTGTFQENLEILSRNITLIGGHPNCSSTTPNDRSQISGTLNPDPAVRAFLGSSGSYTVSLQNLRLVNGSQNQFYNGGGLAVRSSGATFTLELVNLRVDNNSGRRGGGVFIGFDPGTNGTAFVTLHGDTRIHDNAVTDPNALGEADGGGLYCRGNIEILKTGGRIFNNTAGTPAARSGRGAGLHLNGCRMFWYSGPASHGPGTLDNNTAHGRGGGGWVSNGGELWLFGQVFQLFGIGPSLRPLEVHRNRVNGLGVNGHGGAFWVSSGGKVHALNSWVHRNVAENSGGAFYVAGEDSRVEVRRTRADCHTPRRCSEISLNDAGLFGTPGGQAAVANLVFGGQALIERTSVGQNFANGIETGGLFRIAGGSRLQLRHSTVWSAGGRNTFGFSGDSSDPPPVLEVRFSTIANTVMPGDRVFRDFSGSAHVEIFDSIIHALHSGTMGSLGANATFNVDCVLWHEPGPFTGPGASATQIGNPLFSFPLNGEFYLLPGSPAINFCNFGDTPNVDIEWRPRGILHSGQPAFLGPYDLGAHEMPTGMFRDRFE